MNDQVFKGSCLCGAIEYEIRPPYLFFHYCHCSRCRKSSGAAHSANILLKRSQFAWARGEELVKRFELPSAAYYCTGFCAVCGSSIPWESRNGKYMLVPAGTLDDDPGQRPQHNIYWESRAPWYGSANDLPTFAEGAEDR